MGQKKRKEIQAKRNIQDAKDTQEFGACPVLRFHVKSEITDTIDNLIIQDEIDLLKKGETPSQMIYTGKGSEQLTMMDNDISHPYSLLINDGIQEIFRRYGVGLKYYYPRLQECLSKANNWIDIGTGNGIVSNNIGFSMSTLLIMAKLDYANKLIKESPQQYVEYAQNVESKPVNFISCDLSKTSLSHAEKISKNHFFQLEKLFDLEYYFGDLEKLIHTKGKNIPKIITMFNMLANFSYEETKAILQKVYNAMGNNDIYIPTFFNKNDNDNKWKRLTHLLYQNKETQEWIVSSFADRYKVCKEDIVYDVQVKNDGRLYIDIGVKIPEDVFMQIPKGDGSYEKIIARECVQSEDRGYVRFTTLKSYRMTEKEVLELCESVGFKAEGVVYTKEDLQIVPILYK